jgi:hypothetical protein
VETPRVGNGLAIVYREAQTAGFLQYQSRAVPKPVSYDFMMMYFEDEEADAAW